MNWEGYERRRQWPEFQYYTGTWPEGLRKIRKK
jgi:hypothetical protein